MSVKHRLAARWPIRLVLFAAVAAVSVFAIGEVRIALALIDDDSLAEFELNDGKKLIGPKVVVQKENDAAKLANANHEQFIASKLETLKSEVSEAPEMESTIKKIWSEIQAVTKAQKMTVSLKGPATTDSIKKLEGVLGYKLPSQLRESLLIHNGTDRNDLLLVNRKDLSQGYIVLGTEAIEKRWLSDRKQQREAEAEGDLFAKLPTWIPIVVDSAEGDEQVYLDTQDGTVLMCLRPASDEVQAFRYPDYATFLAVIHHHMNQGLWFEWGNKLNAKARELPFRLNDAGIKKLQGLPKDSVQIQSADGSVISVADNGDSVVNAILDSFKPVKYTRTPGVQKPQYLLTFQSGAEKYEIAISVSEEHLSYSVGNVQFAGGNPKKFKRQLSKLQE